MVSAERCPCHRAQWLTLWWHSAKSRQQIIVLAFIAVPYELIPTVNHWGRRVCFVQHLRLGAPFWDALFLFIPIVFDNTNTYYTLSIYRYQCQCIHIECPRKSQTSSTGVYTCNHGWRVHCLILFTPHTESLWIRIVQVLPGLISPGNIFPVINSPMGMLSTIKSFSSLSWTAEVPCVHPSWLLYSTIILWR